MIKITFCLTRRKDQTVEQFLTYWFAVHAPLVLKLRHDLKIVRYVQSRPFEDVRFTTGIQKSRGSPVGFDGIAEIWWPNIDSINQAISSTDGRRASELLLEDERKFIDLEKSPVWYAVERKVFGDH